MSSHIFSQIKSFQNTYTKTNTIKIMPTFNMDKKLRPAGKAWKSLLKHSKILNSSIKTFRQRCKAAWRKSISPIIHHTQNSLSLSKRSPPPPPPPHSRCRHLRLPGNSFIYVDELMFPGPVSLAEPRKAKTRENMNGVFAWPVDKSGPGSSSSLESHNSDRIQTRRSTVKVPGNGNKGPQFRGIDERAEEFIAKFRQDLKLEREKSIHDFQEMLKRSA